MGGTSGKAHNTGGETRRVSERKNGVVGENERWPPEAGNAGMKEGPGLLEQDGARNVSHTKEHDEMITQAKKTVKRANWLKEFHVRSGLTSAEIVELIRPLCPGFDKPLLVKCENPDKYGTQLSAKAVRLLKEWEKNHDGPA